MIKLSLNLTKSISNSWKIIKRQKSKIYIINSKCLRYMGSFKDGNVIVIFFNVNENDDLEE